MLDNSRATGVLVGLGILLGSCSTVEQQPAPSSREVVARLGALSAFRGHLGREGRLELGGGGYRLAGDRLDAVLPASSRAPLRIGRIAIDSSLPREVTSEPVGGALVFRDAALDTDVVLVAEPTRVEEIRVLRTPRASAHATYRIDAHGVRVREGRVEIVDDDGKLLLNTERMFAVDVQGTRRELTVAFVEGRVEVDLDTRGLQYPIAIDPVWTVAPSMGTARRAPAVARLPSGKLLVAGGVGLSTAEVFDFSTRTWSAGGTMSMARALGAAHTLSTGKVLIVGGASASTVTELYDETSKTFTAGGALTTARQDFASVKLATGQVLVAGGNPSGPPISTAELYEPTTNTWTAVGSMSVPRDMPTMITLASGKVLVVGGKGSGVVYSSAEVFDPTAKTWSTVAPMSTARQVPAIALLSDGRVLVAGGFNSESGSFVGFDSAEIYDPVANTWTSTPTMTAKRVLPGVAVLSSGRVLLTGSGFLAPFLSSAEVYDPVTNKWSSAGTMTTARGTHFTFAPPTGAVLVGGGYDGTNALASTEEYTPLSNGSTCTADGACASGHCVDTVCCDRACGGQCEACDLAGKVGACSSVTGAPRGGRPACSDGAGDPCKAKTCGGTDGSACVYAPAGTVSCGTASCTAGVETHPAKCDGAGACADTPKPCGAFKCGATACLTTCGGDADCTTGSYCNAGSCVSKVGLGEPCSGASACASGLFCTDGVCCATSSCEAGSACNTPTKKGACAKKVGTTCGSPDECGSGFCVDGFCCDSACNGQCEACDVADEGGSFGKCTAVTGKPHGTRTACPSDATNPCSVSSCDGDARSSCKAFVGASVPCRTGSCVDGTLTAPAACNGTGVCPEPVTSSCNGFACEADGLSCKTSCTSNTDCITPNVCTSGACRLPAGTCSDDGLSLVSASGAITSCAPYRCANDQCPTRCESSAECSPGNVCDPASAACVPGAPATEDSGGCAYGGSPRFGVVGLLMALSLVARRRRARTP